jgi:hypothetical protein
MDIPFVALATLLPGFNPKISKNLNNDNALERLSPLRFFTIFVRFLLPNPCDNVYIGNNQISLDI